MEEGGRGECNAAIYPSCPFFNYFICGSNDSFSGTFFILYDFIQYFKKDNPSFLPRSDFLEIIEKIFGEQWPVSQLEKDAIIFQVFFCGKNIEKYVKSRLFLIYSIICSTRTGSTLTMVTWTKRWSETLLATSSLSALATILHNRY